MKEHRERAALRWRRRRGRRPRRRCVAERGEAEAQPRPSRASGAPLAPRPFLAFIRRFKHSDYDSDVEDIETDIWPKAGHLNRLQCKVMTSNVIRTSVDEGVQPRERRSHSAERGSTSSDHS